MEVNEPAKIAIVRPVASRPRCPIYKSFSELLAGAVDISSTNVRSEMAITAIRPKTVRLKPVTNHALVGESSSQVDFLSFYASIMYGLDVSLFRYTSMVHLE